MIIINYLYYRYIIKLFLIKYCVCNIYKAMYVIFISIDVYRCNCQASFKIISSNDDSHNTIIII